MVAHVCVFDNNQSAKPIKAIYTSKNRSSRAANDWRTLLFSIPNDALNLSEILD